MIIILIANYLYSIFPKIGFLRFVVNLSLPLNHVNSKFPMRIKTLKYSESIFMPCHVTPDIMADNHIYAKSHDSGEPVAQFHQSPHCKFIPKA